MPEFDFLASLPSVAPEVGLTILAMVIILLDSYLPAEKRKNIALVAAITMGFIALTPFIWAPPAAEMVNGDNLYWGGMLRHDVLSQVFKVIVILAGALTSLMSYTESGVGKKGEFHLIIVIATVGGCLLSASADLIMVFVALETLSIPLYILASFRRTDERSAEAGLKYFLFGSFASAILLYGFSLLYGFTSETSLTGIAAALREGTVIGDNIVPVLAAMVMVIVGFGFKISVAPFHFWTPDVYEGAPTPVTAFISVASKAASFALLMRFFIAVFPESLVLDGQSVQSFWTGFVSIVAIISMTLGNVLALRQSNIKRMLAYSSIAQAGYTLIGIAALQTGDPTYGISSVAFYMFMYTFSNLLAFACVILFVEKGGSERIADMASLQRRSPWLAIGFTIALLSLGGVPPVAGFFGKFFLFQAAVDAGLIALAIIGVLNSIVALYYYLVVIKIVWVDPSEDADKTISIPASYGWTLAITSVMVLILGVIPTQFIDWARDGAGAVVQAAQSIVSAGL